MQTLIGRIREALAAGAPVEDLLGELEQRVGAAGQAGEPARQVADQVAELTDRVGAVTAERDAARALADTALDRYRTARAEALGVAPELLPGTTLETIDAATERARSLVTDLESRLRDQIAGRYVPAGDGGRITADLSALAPIDKIKAGLAQRK